MCTNPAWGGPVYLNPSYWKKSSLQENAPGSSAQTPRIERTLIFRHTDGEGEGEEEREDFISFKCGTEGSFRFRHTDKRAEMYYASFMMLLPVVLKMLEGDLLERIRTDVLWSQTDVSVGLVHLSNIQRTPGPAGNDHQIPCCTWHWIFPAITT